MREYISELNTGVASTASIASQHDIPCKKDSIFQIKNIFFFQ